MNDTRRKRNDGVRTLEQLRQSCVIDDETGCWLWRGAMSVKPGGHAVPRVWMPHSDGVRDADGKLGKAQTGARAAWTLAGRRLRRWQIIWRQVCWNTQCINPEHGVAGTRREMGAAETASGHMQGNPERAAKNIKSSSRQLLPVETVRKAEAMFAAGATSRAVKRELHISNASTARIRNGLHPNCSTSQRVRPAASVFAWASRVDERKAA
jgi:hypothetical protein